MSQSVPGPIEYEWNVDLQVSPNGQPALTYFLTDSQDLVFTSRGDDGAWAIEIVAQEGDTGRFSSLAFDPVGVAHIAYWNADTGEVGYASNPGGGWTNEPVAVLDSVEIGFEGARRITSIDIHPDGTPVIAYSDVSGIWLAERTPAGEWSTERVITAGERPLGQLLSMELDGAGSPHLAFFEVTVASPIDGVVAYATR